jgi:uncharacterized YceG family protein
MAEPPRRLSLPPGYRIPRRRPNRGQIIRRRLFALVILAGLVALLYGVVRVALDHGSGSRSTTTVVKPFTILFPEGFTRHDMADKIATEVRKVARPGDVKPTLSSSAYLRLTRLSSLPGRYAGDGKPRSLEGFLFPATYDYLVSTSTQRLVNDQLAAFRENWRKVDLRYARSKHLTAYDVLIIASMIEKEVQAPEERSKVARVIYNRLHLHMYLGIDATLIYGLDLKQNELVSHLNSRTPYNTRNHYGLPPTPIANPGLASMQAAAHPAKGSYIYYLLKPNSNGHHYFTSSSADFVAHERTWGYIK